MKRLGIAVLVLGGGLLPAGTGHAAPQTVRAATPEGRAAELRVREEGGLLCLTPVVGDETARRSAPCTAASSGAQEDPRRVRVTYRATPEALTVVYGTASSATRALLLTFAGGRSVLVRPEGEHRAYLAVVRGRPKLGSVRARDAGGRTIAAADFDPRALAPDGGTAFLARTRDERGVKAGLTAFRARLFGASGTRRTAQSCVALASLPGLPRPYVEPGYSGGSACTPSRRRIAAKFLADCGTRRLVLLGLAPSAISRLTLVTASGRRLAVPAYPVPRSAGGGLAFLLSGRDPGRLARLDAYSASGRRVSVTLAGVGGGCSAAASSRS